MTVAFLTAIPSARTRLDGLSVEMATLPDGTVRLRLAGELDLFSGERLRSAARAAHLPRCARFEVDTEQVSFVDCAGMRALIEVLEAMEDAGACVVMILGPAVARIRRLTGLATWVAAV
jgi:anti-anti-sigma factor